MSKNRAIGKDGDLPWKIPEDLKFFKKMTNGKIMIMGRKTFESLPGQLPNRLHIVISRSGVVAIDEPDVIFVRSIDEAIATAKKHSAKYPGEVFIAGGAQIYEQTMPLVQKIYLTLIDAEFEGDTFFPAIPADHFLLVDENQRPGHPPFSFQTYLRKG